MIGSGFPYSEFLPKEGQARAVQIDLQPNMLSLRYPMEVNLVGDTGETLQVTLTDANGNSYNIESNRKFKNRRLYTSTESSSRRV